MKQIKSHFFRSVLSTVTILALTIVSQPMTAQAKGVYADVPQRQLLAAQQMIERMKQSDMVLSSIVVGGYQWEARADFADPRTGTGIEGATGSLIGDTIYVSHGYRGGDGALLSAYDISTNTWFHGGPRLPDAAVGRSEMSGGTALGRHYAIGGRTGPSDAVEEFDPVTGAWTTKTPMPGGARGGAGAASSGGKIYVIGGRTGDTYGAPPLVDRNEVYDAATNSWATLTPIPTPVTDNYATVAFGDRVYVFGGADAAGLALSAVQIYNITTNSWSSGTAMPTARGAAMAGVCQDRIIVFGGIDSGFVTLAATEIYNPATDSWTAGPDMPFPSNEITQGKIYDNDSIYSIGTGIFGVSGVTVQELVCDLSEANIPALNMAGLVVLALILALLSVVFLMRRRTGQG